MNTYPCEYKVLLNEAEVSSEIVCVALKKVTGPAMNCIVGLRVGLATAVVGIAVGLLDLAAVVDFGVVIEVGFTEVETVGRNDGFCVGALVFKLTGFLVGEAMGDFVDFVVGLLDGLGVVADKHSLLVIVRRHIRIDSLKNMFKVF